MLKPAFETLARIAKQKNVPVMVDAAAELLTVPNVHLQRGATLVGYSGGKVMRGPQAAGILIGRKDLIQAAWMHSAPHHGYGRSMKVGKEEAMGMLMAVEMWMKRDHKTEMKQFVSSLENIATLVNKVDGVTTNLRKAEGLSNHTPYLDIRWDANKKGITRDELIKTLFTTEPRITVASGTNGITIAAYMLSPGDDNVIGNRVATLLSEKRPARVNTVPQPAAADLSGRWDVKIDFNSGSTTHILHIRPFKSRATKSPW